MHCEVGEWSEWSPCSKSGRTCGFKRGQETRTRQVMQYPSSFGKPCPEVSEIRECMVRRRKCPGKEKKYIISEKMLWQSSTAFVPNLNPTWCDIKTHNPPPQKELSNKMLTIYYTVFGNCCWPITLTANIVFELHGTVSILYEFQTTLLKLEQPELAVLPLRTTTVYSEDCHCR